MITPLHSIKLRNEHLTRPALVYVRQSSLCRSVTTRPVRPDSINSLNGPKTSDGRASRGRH